MTSAAAATSQQETLELPDPGFESIEQQKARELAQRRLEIRTGLFFRSLENGDQDEAVQRIKEGIDFKVQLPKNLVNLISDKGNTPLIRAVRRKNVAAVKALLDAGADPNHLSAGQELPILFCSFDPDSRFYNADSEEELEILKLLIEKDAMLPEDVIMRLIETDQLRKFEYLYQQGKVNFKSTDPDSGETILHKLSVEENLRYWKRYFSEALRNCEIDATDQSGETALHGACDLVIIDNAEELIKNSADINAKDDLGLTPIMHTIKSDLTRSEDDRLNLVNILIKSGSDLTLTTEDDSMCALHFAVIQAAKTKDCRILELIIDKMQSQELSIDKPNKRLRINSTELALINNNPDIYDFLVLKGAAPIVFSSEVEDYMVAKNMSRVDVIRHEEPGQLKSDAAEFAKKVAKSQKLTRKLLKQEEERKRMVAEKVKREAARKLKNQTTRVAGFEVDSRNLSDTIQELQARVKSTSSRSKQLEALEKAKKEERMSQLRQEARISEANTKTERQTLDDLLEESIEIAQEQIESEKAKKMEQQKIKEQASSSDFMPKNINQGKGFDSIAPIVTEEKPRPSLLQALPDRPKALPDMKEVHKRVDAEIAQDQVAEQRAQMMIMQRQLHFLNDRLDYQYDQNQLLANQNHLLIAEIAELKLMQLSTTAGNQYLTTESHNLQQRMNHISGEFEKLKRTLEPNPRLESKLTTDLVSFTPPPSDSDRSSTPASSTPSEGHHSPADIGVDDAAVKDVLKFVTIHGINAEIDPNKPRTIQTLAEVEASYPDIDTKSLEAEDADVVFRPELQSPIAKSSSLPNFPIANARREVNIDVKQEETPTKRNVVRPIAEQAVKRKLQLVNQKIASGGGARQSEQPSPTEVEYPASPHGNALGQEAQAR